MPYLSQKKAIMEMKLLQIGVVYFKSDEQDWPSSTISCIF